MLLQKMMQKITKKGRSSIVGDIKNFIKQYRGAIIGIIIAILILITNLQKLIIGIILIAIGAIIGNYVQQNKDIVKERLKNLIDRM